VAVVVGLGLGLGLGLTGDRATWAKLAPLGASPSVRYGQSVAYDSTDSLVIVFGGAGPSDYLSDTWAYDPVAGVWTERHPSGSVPSKRALQAMAYDSDSKQVVLFGGLSDPADMSSCLDDTWIYEPAADRWKELHPVGPVPSARAGHTMAYDPIAKRVILFGGGGDLSGAAGSLDSTWAYDPSENTWTELKPDGPVPTPRQCPVMAYDSAKGLMMVFGGAHYPRDLNDLWAYDPSANTWVELRPSGPLPVGQNGGAFDYDPLVDRLVLFGGFSGGSESAAEGFGRDTWEYDFAKNKWTEIAPEGQTPIPRQYASLVFCPTLGRAILFGGVTSKAFLNDIWAFGR
jgi:N-acetylneuraminic acid mutarotase